MNKFKTEDPQKKYWRQRESNAGPLSCKPSMLTTRPPLPKSIVSFTNHFTHLQCLVHLHVGAFLAKDDPPVLQVGDIRRVWQVEDREQVDARRGCLVDEAVVAVVGCSGRVVQQDHLLADVEVTARPQPRVGQFTLGLRARMRQFNADRLVVSHVITFD